MLKMVDQVKKVWLTEVPFQFYRVATRVVETVLIHAGLSTIPREFPNTATREEVMDEEFEVEEAAQPLLIHDRFQMIIDFLRAHVLLHLRDQFVKLNAEVQGAERFAYNLIDLPQHCEQDRE